MTNRLAQYALLVVGLLVQVCSAAEQITVLSSVGIKAVVEELAPRFEQASGHDVAAVFDLASVMKTKIEGGEPFDVAILTPALIDELIAKGLVAPESRAVIARVGLGLMIRAGASKPDVGTVEAFAQTLRDARAVTYATAGASGVAFVAIIDRLGIGPAVRGKALPAASPEEVVANVLSGAAELAVLPISEILPVAGAELGGVFPAEVQTYVEMATGVGTRSRAGSAAAAFVEFLMAPASTAAVEANGMERVGPGR